MAQLSSQLHTPVGLVLAKEIIANSRKIGYGFGEAYGEYCLGKFYDHSQKYKQADSLFNKCLSFANKNDQKGLSFLATYQLGRVQNAQSFYAESIPLFEKALSFAKQLKDSSKIALCHLEIGHGYYFVANYKKALYHLFRSIDYNNSRTKSDEVNALNFIAQVYYMKDDYSEALKYYLQQLKLAADIDDQKAIARTYGQIGELYRSVNDYKKAVDYYEWSLKRATELKDLESVAFTYNCLGEAYFVQGEFKQAVNCFEKAITVALKISDKDSYAYGLNMAGACYSELNELKKATEYQYKAISVFREIDDQVQIASAWMYLANDHRRSKKYGIARQYIDSAIKVSKAYSSHDNLKDSYLVLSKILDETGKSAEAFAAFKMHTLYRDSLLNSDKLNSFANVELKDREDQLKLEQQRKDAIYKAEQASQIEKLKREKLIKYCFAIGALLLLLLAVVIFRSLKESRKAKKIIEEQKGEVEEQKKVIEERNKEVMDSINYAKRIQYALLAHRAFLTEHLPEHFVLFKPKDIVSGDFYWAAKVDECFYLAVCDSTGHGVPGAFMSLLNIGYLSEAINEKHIKEPNKVFDHVRERLIRNLSQDERKDGMDGVLLCYDMKTKSITYASANNAPVLVSKGATSDLDKNKMPVGKGELSKPFDLFELKYDKGDMLYLFTDGYADQFGGPKGKKFKYKQLETLLGELSKKQISAQGEMLDEALNNWKGSLEQVDDVCIIGIKL